MGAECDRVSRNLVGECTSRDAPMAEVSGSPVPAADEFIGAAAGSCSSSLRAKMGTLGQNVSLARAHLHQCVARVPEDRYNTSEGIRLNSTLRTIWKRVRNRILASDLQQSWERQTSDGCVSGTLSGSVTK